MSPELAYVSSGLVARAGMCSSRLVARAGMCSSRLAAEEVVPRTRSLRLSPCSCVLCFVLAVLSLLVLLLLLLLLVFVRILRSVVLLRGEDTLASFLELEEGKKAKTDGDGSKGDSWWDGESVAEAVV